MAEKILVIGSGQSNALGGNGGEGGDQTVNSRVKVWRNGAWDTATLGSEPFAVPVEGQLPRNNAIWNFCKRLQEVRGCEVYLVLVAKGGAPISTWAAPAGEQWVKLNTDALAALASDDMQDKCGPDYFFWFQGENDYANTNYLTDFLTLRDNAIAAGWLQRETPVIAGEIVPNGSQSKNALFELLADRSATWFNIAPNEGIEISGTGPHFTAQGYIDYGRKSFFNTAMRTPRGDLPFYRSWTPILTFANGSTSIQYDIENTYGGSHRCGNLVHAWFKAKLTGLSGASGAAFITGLPYPISATAPDKAAYVQTGIAAEVAGVNFTEPAPVLFRTAAGNGLKLLRATSTGTTSLYAADISGSFCVAGSISYFID